MRLQQDDESICSERQTELAEEGLNNVLPRSDIPVNEFPDYVRRVAEEYGDSGSKLADEYFVSILLSPQTTSNITFLFIFNSILSTHVQKPTMWLLFLIMLTSTDSGTSIHVRKGYNTSCIINFKMQ